MKTLFLTTALVCFMVITNYAQAVNKDVEVKYRRNSLHLILLESADFPRKETVEKAYANAPFPDKYDNHLIGFKSFNYKLYNVSEEERKSVGVKKSFMSNLGASALSSVTSTNIENDGADMPIIIDKFIKEKKIANLLIAKWFNRQKDGSFDTKLIADRGFYNASEMEANIAKKSARGNSSLGDAGEELISNTFVVFTKLQFVSNEPAAAIIRDLAKAKAAKLPFLLQEAATRGLDVAYNKAKEGYSVWTNSYLYRLKWDENTAAIFYDKYWMDKKNVNEAKNKAFLNSSEFEMEYVGTEKSSTLVTFSLKEKRTEDQIVELATIRNMENVFAKLQKSYDVFMPKTPLYSGEPITAKIGLKEGIEGGDKFEVLEQTLDPKTGLTVYLRKGIITVDKNMIWDNRYNAGDDENKKNTASNLDKTTFKGGKNYFAGMLIKQIK